MATVMISHLEGLFCMQLQGAFNIFAISTMRIFTQLGE